MAGYETTRRRFRPAIVAIAPAVLLAGFAYHPYVSRPTDEAALAVAAASDTTRWGLSHPAIGVGYGLAVLAFIAIRSYLREVGEERWSVLALPFTALGCAMFPILTGMECALLAAAETGGDVEGAQTELTPWFVPLLVMGGISSALGALGFAIGITRSKMLSAQLTSLVTGATLDLCAALAVDVDARRVAATTSTLFHSFNDEGEARSWPARQSSA